MCAVEKFRSGVIVQAKMRCMGPMGSMMKAFKEVNRSLPKPPLQKLVRNFPDNQNTMTTKRQITTDLEVQCR